MKVVRAGNKWAIESKYSPAVIRHCKSTPGCRWSAALHLWVSSKDAVACVVEKLKKDEILIDDSALQSYSFAAEDLTLRPYQREAVGFLLQNAPEGAICALDMGLGKTFTSIRTVSKLGARTLVVCPAYVRPVWQAELKKWDPGLRVQDLRGTKPGPNDLDLSASVYLINYDILHAWKALLLPLIQLVILDECHILADSSSRRGQACMELCAAATWKIGLTGTPMTGRLKTLWHVVEILSPGRFGSFFQFCKRYTNAEQETITFRNDGPKTVWKFEGSANVEELASRMKVFMFRKTREEVALELPSKTRELVLIEGKKSGFDIGLLSPKLFRAALDASADASFLDRAKIVQAKVEGTDENVVVFCYRRAVAESLVKELAAAGIEADYIHGGITGSKREELLKSPPRVLVATIDSVATGISLTHASIGIFFELVYEPQKLLQAEARLHRFGQAKGVCFYYLLAEGTADELVRDVVLSKLDDIQLVVGDKGDGLAGSLKGVEKTEDEIFEELFKSL